jgi:hypothetical protein
VLRHDSKLCTASQGLLPAPRSEPQLPRVTTRAQAPSRCAPVGSRAPLRLGRYRLARSNAPSGARLQSLHRHRRAQQSSSPAPLSPRLAGACAPSRRARV